MNEIRIPRGTSLCLTIQIFENNQLRTYSASDVVKFCVKADVNQNTCLITKNAVYGSENNCYTVTLVPEDTANFSFDRYWYDVSLQTSSGDFFIIVPCSEFNVVRAVSKKGASV